MNKTRAFRRRFDRCREKIIVAPGVHDPYCAKIAEAIGYDVIYMGGAVTSMSKLGMPDFGLITASEIVANVKYIANAVKVPLLADADTGYGNALNVMRTIREYLKAGAVGLHIEDQVWSKRCGHLKGKLVISKDEMVGRIKAARKVIAEEDPDFVLIARTDVRGVTGGGFDIATERLKAYAKAGADAVFADAIVSKDEVAKLARAVDAPMVFHPTGISPRLSVRECQELGVGIMIYPFASFHAMAIAVWDFLADLKWKDTTAQVELEERVRKHPLKDLRSLFDLAGLKELQEYEQEFLSSEELEVRYKASIGE